MYIPGTPSIPLLTEKHEVGAQIGTSTNSIKASGAYAYSDKYAIMGAVSVSHGYLTSAYDLGDLLNPDNTYNGGSFKHWSSEMAIGKYNYFPNFIFETYTGVVYGSSETEYSRFQNSYGSFFLQANMGFKKDIFELGFGLRFSGSKFNYTYPNSADVKIEEQFPVVSVHSGGIIRVGGEKVKFWLSPGLNYSRAIINKSADELRLGYQEGRKYQVFESSQNNFYTIFHLGAGVHFSF